jgi:hypothetical protein
VSRTLTSKKLMTLRTFRLIDTGISSQIKQCIQRSPLSSREWCCTNRGDYLLRLFRPVYKINLKKITRNIEGYVPNNLQFVQLSPIDAIFFWGRSRTTLQQDRQNGGLHFHPSLAWIADTFFSPQSMHPLLCFHVPGNANYSHGMNHGFKVCTTKCKSMNLHNCIGFFIHFAPGAFSVDWRCSSDSIRRVLSFLQFLQSPSLPNFDFTSIYYGSIHRFYLHSKFDCFKKPVN